MKISGNTDFIGSEDRHLHKSRCGQHKIASFIPCSMGILRTKNRSHRAFRTELSYSHREEGNGNGRFRSGTNELNQEGQSAACFLLAPTAQKFSIFK